MSNDDKSTEDVVVVEPDESPRGTDALEAQRRWMRDGTLSSAYVERERFSGMGTTDGHALSALLERATNRQARG